MYRDIIIQDTLERAADALSGLTSIAAAIADETSLLAGQIAIQADGHYVGSLADEYLVMETETFAAAIDHLCCDLILQSDALRRDDEAAERACVVMLAKLADMVDEAETMFITLQHYQADDALLTRPLGSLQARFDRLFPGGPEQDLNGCDLADSLMNISAVIRARLNDLLALKERLKAEALKRPAAD